MNVWKDPDWLYAQYWGNNKSTADMGNMVGVTSQTILYWMDRLAIPRRTTAKSTQLLEYKEKMSRSLSGNKNPRWGVKLSAQQKEQISKSEKEYYKKLNPKGTKLNAEQALKRRIRDSHKYRQWKNAILERDVVGYPHIPKGTQVHHIKSFNEILKDNHITTITEAEKCEELWDVNNGVALRKGEHYVITQLERMRKISEGFLLFIENFITENKFRATPIGGLSFPAQESNMKTRVVDDIQF